MTRKQYGEISELALECFYPADAATSEALHRLARE